MPGVGLTPGSPVATEDVRNLKRGTHDPNGLGLGIVLLLLDEAEPVQGAHHLPDRAGSHPRVERCRIKLRVSEGPQVIMLTFYVIETEGSAERDRLLADAAGHSARDKRRYPPP